MPAAEPSGEAAVFPGMIEVVVSVAAPGVVADPFAVGMNVRRVGMSALVVEVTVLRGGMRSAHRRGTVVGGVRGVFTTGTAMMLGKNYERKQEANCNQSDQFFHVHSFPERPGGL